MNSQEIQQKIAELEAIMSKYRLTLSRFEKELSSAILDYHRALEEEKLKEIKARLKI